MQERVVFALLGPFTLTAYGVTVALGALLGSLWALWLGRRQGLARNATLELLLCVLPGALLGARLLYCLAMFETIAIDFGLAFIPRLWEGGYTLYGGVLGGLGAAWLYARLRRQKLAPLADVLAPGAALFVAVARLAEAFTTQGLGLYLEDTALQRFPFAVQDAYGYWAMPVFLYEAFAALVIAGLCAIVLRNARPGVPTALFLALLSLTQILLDSWRQDEYIRFGFVHLNQLAAAAVLLALLARSVARHVRLQGWNGWQRARPALFAALLGALVWVEFARDKSSIDNRLLYGVMAVVLVAMGFVVLFHGEPRPVAGATAPPR